MVESRALQLVAKAGEKAGIPVTLCMPENVSPERKRILQAYGANILYTNPDDGSDGAIRVARELYAKQTLCENPGS
jgi:cysteine synthase B